MVIRSDNDFFLVKTILERLNDGEVIIGDGGYITEMERRGYATAGPWTPEVNVEHPQAGLSGTNSDLKSVVTRELGYCCPQ